MTYRHPVRTNTPALALAMLFALTGTLGAQTAETQPEVVFHVQMLQAERAAGDKLAAERVTLSKADFNTSETINVHILNETTDVVALVNGEASRSTLDVLSVPTLSTRNGLEAKFLVGARKEVPTEPDTLGEADPRAISTETQRAAGPDTLGGPLPDAHTPDPTTVGTAPPPNDPLSPNPTDPFVEPPPLPGSESKPGEEEPVDLKLPEHDFGMQLNFQPFILPNGKIRVRLRPRVTSANYTDATLRGGRYVPSISTRQTDATYDVKPGQTIALTGLLNDEIIQQLRRSAGAADEPLLKHLIDARTAKTGTNLVPLVTPELVDGGGGTR